MATLEALKAIEEKKEQLKVNLRDIANRKAQLDEELARLRAEAKRVSDMLKALEAQFPTSACEALLKPPTIETV